MIVRAEWPGYVVDVLVRPGQEVEEDEPLIIIEGTDASRTSFYINAPEGGKVREILIEEGDFAYEDDDLVSSGTLTGTSSHPNRPTRRYTWPSSPRWLMAVVKAEMAGKVLEVCVTEGQIVAEEQDLIIVDSMKMQIPVGAPQGGTVRKVFVAAEQFLNEGDAIVELS